MDRVQVEFLNVGRDRLCWDQWLNEFDGQNIIWAIKQQIPNAEPDVSYNEDHGTIYADGIDIMGSFRRIA